MKDLWFYAFCVSYLDIFASLKEGLPIRFLMFTHVIQAQSKNNWELLISQIKKIRLFTILYSMTFKITKTKKPKQNPPKTHPPSFRSVLNVNIRVSAHLETDPWLNPSVAWNSIPGPKD